MLFECSCEATKNIIDNAIQKSIALRPLSDTPLAALVNSTTVVPIKDLTGQLDENLRTIPDDVLKEQSNNGLHNGYTDQVSEMAANVLNRRIDVLRNTVIPVIRSIGEAVIASIDESQLHSNTMDVVKYAACDLIFVPSFMEDVKRNTGSSYLTPSVSFSEDPIAVSKLLEMLNTGSKTADEALAITINRLGQDTIFHIWESLFVDGSKISGNYSTFDQVVMNPVQGLDKAIIVFILANILQSKNSTAARQYKEAAAYYISTYARSYNKDIESGLLIKNIENNCITVYTVNYVQFLQKGGTVEMVIGAANTNGHYHTVEDILENSETVMENYRVLKGAREIEYRSKVSAIAKEKFYNEFYRSLSHERSDFEKDYFAQNAGVVDTISKKFDTLLNMLTSEGIKDIYIKITEIVCQSRFYYLDCYKFMLTMEELNQSKHTPEEALTQSTLLEICSFVTKMMTK